ncbi:MAG: hypothetical protein Kow0075_13120 [Salibacteraceae bacterium]
MVSEKLNNFWVGFAAGITGPWFGLIIFYLIFFRHKTFWGFIELILQHSDKQSGTLALSLIFNLVFFYAALRNDWYYAARGVIGSMFLYAPIVIYLKYA